MKNLKQIKEAYFMGIKGVGMTMLAQYLSNLKIKISGSDICQEFMTDKVLRKISAKVYCPYKKDNINKEADLFVYTSALEGQNNPELEYILKNKKLFSKKQILNYAQTLALIFNKQKGIAVCGSHGKTTTSAWLGFVLKELKLSPQVLVGSYVGQFKGNVYLGKSNLMVAETDEYQNKLRHFMPFGVVLNNIDFDHPDFFKTKADYFQVFLDFVKKIPKNGFLVVNIDDKLAKETIKYCKAKVITYSILNDKKALLFVSQYETKNNFNHFILDNFGDFKVSLLGKHNIYNALAVLGTCMALKIDLKKAKKPLAKFLGTARRAELLGNYKEVPIYDDYAHHPTELKATFSAFKEKYPNRRLVVLFHPHTFSRTKALFKDFSQSFSQVDVLGVLQIFSSAREKKGKISSLDLVKAIQKEKKDTFVSYIDNFDLALMWLKKTLAKNDVLLLVGAGDVNKVGENLIKMEK
jgi:UDP-N-acetylmuramate--alanine ligase